MTQFKDLKFKNHHGGINTHHVFDNDWKISVTAGKMAYCNPREDDLDSSAYSSFEVAVLNPAGDFATGELLQSVDDVVGWCGRDDINNIMAMVADQ